MPKRKDTRTLELFEWQPPQVAVSMPPETVRGGTLGTKISRAVSEALKSSSIDREQVAEAMSEYLEQPVTKNMLDAYASQGREEHKITLERFIALIEVTGRIGLVGFVAEPFDLVAVPAKYADVIELKLIDEQMDVLTQRRQSRLARWKSSQ